MKLLSAAKDAHKAMSNAIGWNMSETTRYEYFNTMVALEDAIKDWGTMSDEQIDAIFVEWQEARRTKMLEGGHPFAESQQEQMRKFARMIINVLKEQR